MSTYDELQQRISTLENNYRMLFKDYNRLAKSHQYTTDAMKDNKHSIKAVTDRLEECCSTDDLIERAVAHNDLAKVVDSLGAVISKLTIVETLSNSLLAETKAREVLQHDVAKLKLYGYMIAGGIVALEFTGALQKIKTIFL